MKRTWALTASFVLCVAIALFLYGCSGDGNSADASAEAVVHISPSVAPVATEIPALEITRGVISNSEGVLLYPYIEGEHAEKINASIKNDVIACADEAEAQVFTTYKITNNSKGIFSAVISVQDAETEELISVLPLNYSVESGEKLSIADYFNEESDRWRRILPDIVTLQAQDKGLTLLCDVMPVTDEQLYYISGDKLVLVYRQYEITTYVNPAPQFSIPISQLAEFLNSESPLIRLTSSNALNGAAVASAAQAEITTPPGIFDAPGAGSETPVPTPVQEGAKR